MGCQPLPPPPRLTRYNDFARGVWRWIAAYAANPDPRVASCNIIALLVASNQPFYRLYVYLSVSRDVAPTLLTFLTPLLPRGPCGLPAMACTGPCAFAPNRSRQCGRERESVWPSVRGGDLHRPVRVDRGGFFSPLGKVFAFALLAVALAIFLGMDSYAFVPVHAYFETEYAAFVRLNALSAGALVALLGLILSGLVRE